MKITARHLRMLTLATAVVVSAGTWTVLRGQGVPTRTFPQAALPSEASLAPPPGVPIPGLDIPAAFVAAMYMDGDALPDLLVASSAGELRGLLNKHGTIAGRSAFTPAPLDASLEGAVRDLAVHDFDADGRDDLALLVDAPGLPGIEPMTLTVATVTADTITINGTTLLPNELVGQEVQPDAERDVRFTVRANGTTTIQLDGAGDLRQRTRVGATLRAERLAFQDGGLHVAMLFNAGGGAFTESPCLPALEHGDREPVGIGAADVDKDGRLDLVLELAPVFRGRAADVRLGAPLGASSVMNRDEDGTGGSGGSGGGTGGSGGGSGGGSSGSSSDETYGGAKSDGTPALTTRVLYDPAVTFPRFTAGARIVADTREGRSFDARWVDPHRVQFTIAGTASIARAGSPYALTLAPDERRAVRNLGQRCFAPTTPAPRPIYSHRDDAGRVVIVDPNGAFQPEGALVGLDVLLGNAPLGTDAPRGTIVAHSRTELTLSGVSAEVAAALRGTVDGGAPSMYALVPPAMPDASSVQMLARSASSFPYPDDRPGFRSPGQRGAPVAAVADVDADGKPDVILASAQLFILFQQ